MSIRYDQARSDFEYLETLAELSDQVDLDAEREDLMRNPTKTRAALMYEAAIRMWFAEHGAQDDEQAQEIEERHAYVR